jgi:predicted glycogen debranching enzyme
MKPSLARSNTAMIRFDRSICSDYDAASSREWLETNGIGGFASGTISGTNTRRYHGLLTAATRPPLGRITTVSKFLELLTVGSESVQLSTSRFSGKLDADGCKFISGFRLDPFPIWTISVGNVEIERKLFMPSGSNTTVVTYSVLGEGKGDNIFLEIKPLLAFVDYHHLQHEDASFLPSFETKENLVSVQPYSDIPTLYFHHNAVAIKPSGDWYKNFEYVIEQERGFEFQEDLFQPFAMRFDLRRTAEVIVSTETKTKAASTLEKTEVRRRQDLIKTAKAAGETMQTLVIAADQFIVKRGSGHTVIAGYPWFSDWGRDTMISLPGLTLSTGRYRIAREILLEFSKHISEGMLPNRFPDAGEEAEYNTVDATLWYFEAVRAYAETSGDIKTIRDDLYEKLSLIVAAHLRGTRYKIHVDTDGLLYAGEPGVQLTWMDAKVGDKVITPRTGKPVEIQGLWYNALRIMQEFALRFGHDEDAARFGAMADLAMLSFNAAFWNDATECLFDVVCNGERDASIRPNQILAASLFHSMLDEERIKKIVDRVESELLTPMGLRSLSPRDPAYVAFYRGGPFERDSAYHQGTVWAWLIGPFVDAYRKVYPDREEHISEILKPLAGHLTGPGVGQVAEIFDAEPPHTPRGCTAQAWSVAEFLRVLQPKRGDLRSNI